MKTKRSARPPRATRHEAARSLTVVPERWQWHYRTLSQLRERLIAGRGEHLREAAEPIEPHSMHEADSATDEFDHDLALSRLSAEQDALYEVEAAMKRILDGEYGACEVTGRRIPAARLRAVPWTRFSEDAEQRFEASGGLRRPHLGALGSVHENPAAALAESEPGTAEEPEPDEPLAEANREPEVQAEDDGPQATTLRGAGNRRPARVPRMDR
jgi:RNA polymerase-binding transcription factor DksA